MINRIYLTTFLLFLSLFGCIACIYHFNAKSIHNFLDAYARAKAEERFGSASIESSLEEKIISIANQIGITEPFAIKKMDSKGMAMMGYGNAFVYFYKIFNVLPITKKPVLFISTGFYEDLSPEEQLFLIGHELIHIKEKDLLYLNLAYFLVIALLIFFCFLLKKYAFFGYIPHYFHTYAFLFLIGVGLLGIKIGYYAYLRNMEWRADVLSLSLLKTHEGGIKFIERTIREYGVPVCGKHLFASHPSNYERRNLCLEFKK